MIEDSRLYQQFLRQVIESDDCLMVVGASASGAEAIELIPQLKPDVVTLDLQLPDCDGLLLLKEILEKWKLPVVAVSGDARACESAIALGARDFIIKMQDADPKSAEQFRLLLKLKLKMQAEVRQDAVHQRQPSERRGGRKDRLIAIGASLGGTEATLQILRRLPDTLPGIVIVQHMPPEYTAAYAMRLDRCCTIRVSEAKNGNQVLPGTALIAMGGSQLAVCRAENGYYVRVGGREKYGGFCPSVDVFFNSAAEAAGPDALGIILTGMGQDGARGLKKMHDAGAVTFGQSEKTCAVFGMPGAAGKLGAVDRFLSPDQIAEEIIRMYSGYQKCEG